MRKIISIILLAIPSMLLAQTDSGMELSVEGSHKFTKKITASVNAEIRTCNDFKSWDRGSIGVDASYKLCNNLKLSAGYNFILDQNEEKINLDKDGVPANWRPSYFGERHRFNVSLTGNADIGRFNVSLRERWQYTYRPEKTRDRYDFEQDEWEAKSIESKAKNVLRSRLQVEYNIRKCPITPFANIETYNAWALEKTRFVVGAGWKLSKKQSLDLFYRYQSTTDNEEEPNRHTVGVSYNFKF